jgi:multimeric flavodoxin WrbA
MTQISIIYESDSVHISEGAKSVARGAESIGLTRVLLIPLEGAELCWQDIDESQAIVFGCSTRMGSASASFKDFMEATAERLSGHKWRDKIAAGFTVDDKQNYGCKTTVVQLCSFSTEHSMIWAGSSIFIINERGNKRDENANQSSRPPDEITAPADGISFYGEFVGTDALGKRVAQIAQRWNWIRRFRSERNKPVRTSKRQNRGSG